MTNVMLRAVVANETNFLSVQYHTKSNIQKCNPPKKKLTI